MARRFDPWQDLINQGLMTRGTYTGYLQAITNWEDLARHHCEARNQCVMYVLMHLQMMRRNSVVPANPVITVQAAIRQMSFPSRVSLNVPRQVLDAMDELGLSQQQRTYVISKAFTTQDAHCLPCQLRVASAPIQNHLDRQTHLLQYAHLNGQFGVVHRMPTMFNESDTQAESRGLIEGLAHAARVLIQQHPSHSPHINPNTLTQAYRSYVITARTGIQAAAQHNLQAYTSESDRGKKFYRLMKARMLSCYADFTEAQTPEQIRHPVLVQHFEQMWG